MAYQRFGRRVVSEGDITQFQFAPKFFHFGLFFFSLVLAFIVVLDRICQHVVNSFHLRPHLNHRRRTLHESHGRFHEFRHKSLKGHKHTNAELSFQNECRSKNEHTAIGKMGEDIRIERTFLHDYLLVVPSCEIAGPKLKEPSFCTCSLNALYIVYTRHGDAVRTSHTLLKGTAEVIAQLALVNHHIGIDGQHHNAQNCEQKAVLQHQCHIESKQHHVYCIRCKNGHQVCRNGFVK